LSKRLIERALAGELNHHLKVEPENELDGSVSVGLAIPRDRKGEFEPVLVPKHQRRLAGLDEKILVKVHPHPSPRSNPNTCRSTPTPAAALRGNPGLTPTGQRATRID